MSPTATGAIRILPLPSGEFFAEVLWDGIVVPMINNPRSVTFIVDRQIGDPIP